MVLSSTLRGRLGPLRLPRPRARPRRRADRGRQRLRLPDGLRAPARRLPHDHRAPPPRAVGGLLRAAARRDAGDAVARRAGRAQPRSRRGRSSRAASRSRGLRARRRRARSAWPRSRSRCGRRCCNDRLEQKGNIARQERDRAPGAVVGRAADGGGPAADRGRAGPLRDRGAGLRAQQPARAREAGRPQLLSAGDGGDRRARACSPSWRSSSLVAAARPLAKTGDRGGRHRRAPARDGDAGVADRGDRRRRVPERAAHDAVLADRRARRGGGHGAARRRTRRGRRASLRGAPPPWHEGRPRQHTRGGRPGRAHADARGRAGRGRRRGARRCAPPARSRSGSRRSGRPRWSSPLRHQLDVGGARRMRHALAGVDVIHGQDRRAGLWIRLLPPAGAARVYTVHGLPEPYLPPPAGPERPGWRARLAYRGVDALLAPPRRRDHHGVARGRAASWSRGSAGRRSGSR